MIKYLEKICISDILGYRIIFLIMFIKSNNKEIWERLIIV